MVFPISSYYRHTAATSVYAELPATEVAILGNILVVSSATTLYETHDLEEGIKFISIAANSVVVVVPSPVDRRRARRFKLTLAEPASLAALLEAARSALADRYTSSKNLVLLLKLKLLNHRFKATAAQTDTTLTTLLQSTEHSRSGFKAAAAQTENNAGTTRLQSTSYPSGNAGANLFAQPTAHTAEVIMKLLVDPKYVQSVLGVSREIAATRGCR